MKKLFLCIIIMTNFNSINLFSADWEWITKDDKGNSFGLATEIKLIDGDIWYSTTTDVYKYENGNFVSLNASPVVEELSFCNLSKLLIDDYGNLIGRNNNGIAWYDGKEWTVLGADDISFIQYNFGLTLTNYDTLVLTLANHEMVKFAWDIEKEKYKQLNNQKIILPQTETRLGNGGALISEEFKGEQALFSTNSSLNLLDIYTGKVINVNEQLQFDNSNIRVFYNYYETDVSYYFIYGNKDSSASIFAIDKNLLYPGHLLTFRNLDWDITKITSVVDYKDSGLLYALGDKLYFTNMIDTILIPKPKILGDDIDNFWYIKTMEIDANDTLWVATLGHGIFKVYAPDLFNTTSVESPDKQWGLADLSITNTYPNPNNEDFINVELYLANDQISNLETNIYDSKGLKLSIKSITYSKIVGNMYNANIDVSGLPTGVYYIKVSNQDASFTKFIKY